jgi:hypothetical protein
MGMWTPHPIWVRGMMPVTILWLGWPGRLLKPMPVCCLVLIRQDCWWLWRWAGCRRGSHEKSLEGGLLVGVLDAFNRKATVAKGQWVCTCGPLILGHRD